MEAKYHRVLLARALAGRVSARALAAITAANVGQDWPPGLFDPVRHFDGSLFAEGRAYIDACLAEVIHALRPAPAWAAFGRLSHTAQDFYAHSNYVHLWLERFPAGSIPPPAAIDGLDPGLLRHPRLVSGHVYWPVDYVYFIGPLRGLALRLAPPDSHARMNLDSPVTGPLFPYAMEAAAQRTVAEFERALGAIGEERGPAGLKAFCE